MILQAWTCRVTCRNKNEGVKQRSAAIAADERQLRNEITVKLAHNQRVGQNLIRL